jgi:signal peptidase I
MKRSVNLTGTDFLGLSRDILEKGKSVRFQAKGWSMRPLIRDGDFILVSPVENSTIKTGDVVLYSATGNKVMVHRLIGKYKRKGRTEVLIKGDATLSPPEKMDIQNVLGKVVAIERNGRKKRLDTKLHRLIGLFVSGISPFSRWIYPLGSVVKHGWQRLTGRHPKESVRP